MSQSFSSEVEQHIADCDMLGLPVQDLVTSIILSADRYPDVDVKRVLLDLPVEIVIEIQNAIYEFEKTGECHLISSTGVHLDISDLMKRISRVLADK
jgi:hypothetical protein